LPPTSQLEVTPGPTQAPGGHTYCIPAEHCTQSQTNSKHWIILSCMPTQYSQKHSGWATSRDMKISTWQPPRALTLCKQYVFFLPWTVYSGPAMSSFFSDN
jgi:hypothetical protein